MRIAVLDDDSAQADLVCETLSAKEIFGEFEFDLRARRVVARGATVAVTQKEFELALLLFQHLSRPLSRAHILDVIWKQVTAIPSRTMDTHVSMLRSKLGLRPEHGYRLTPIYGFGYRLERMQSATQPGTADKDDDAGKA